jgi:cell division protease FtsH
MFAARMKRATRAGLRRWRRRRLSKKRTTSKQTYALILSLLLLGGAFAWSLSYLAPTREGRELRLDEFSALADEKRLDTAVFRDQDALISGSFLCSAPPSATEAKTGPNAEEAAAAGDASTPASSAAPSCSKDGKGESYWVPYPESDATTAMLVDSATTARAEVSIDQQTAKGQVRIVATIVLPLMLLANLFALLFAVGKGSTSGIGEVETFGSIGNGMFRRRHKTPTTFTDVAGADEAVEELKEVRDYLANPERYEEIGAMPPKGVLLVGPPGCGKTLLAKAVAGEVGVPFFSVAGAEFVESLVGVGAARIRDLFRRVRAAAPALVFIDELDAAGRKRAHGGGSGGSDEREQTLNQLLVEMDGFEVSSGIVVMGATNRPDILDPALLRPGRFDRHITIERPDLMGRTEILELHARGKPVGHDVDFGYIARRTPGFSGADLANVVNEAALLAVRQDKEEIETPEFEEAIQRVMVGTNTRGRMLTPNEKKRAAYHESGHVIVAAAAGRVGDIHRVSILAAGRKIGATGISKQSEAAILTRSDLNAELVTLLAGSAAEKLVFREPSTGSEKDLEQATDLALDVIGRYGMNERLGLPRLLAKDVDAFLDADIPLGIVSGPTQHELDQEVRKMLADAEKEAMKVLAQHRETLDLLARRLETEEILEGPDLEGVLALVRPEVELFGAIVGSASGNGHADPVGERV